MKIQPIVEGHGEVEAIPILLRRFCAEARTYDLGVGRPIRRNRSQMLQEDELKKAVRLAILQAECGAVLVVLDAHGDCPKDSVGKLMAWSKQAAGSYPIAVVMAKQEYEAWFLAAVESLRGIRGIREDAVFSAESEEKQGAKEALENLMTPDRSYIETADQAALSESFDMRAAYAKCRSFRKMVKAFGDLVTAAGCNISDWPPVAWVEASP
ncbi:MAG: DUF4276 family protein [Elusimicrobia bacterium]|nr:DUF4276 family protein [Elusimicrobiota bacterium]